jgi:DNA-binding LytR/AlgR family response regulator
MPSIQGLEFYKNLETPVMVIFTTAFPEYAVEGFNVNAIDYLLKPYTYERFFHAVQKALDLFQYSHSHSSQSNRYLLVRVDYSLQRIMFDTILMIEGLDDYLKIHVIDSKPLVVRMTMKSILEKLPQNEFVRVHKSFIVAINKIESIRNKTITIQDKQIPIGNRFEENFQRQFES